MRPLTCPCEVEVVARAVQVRREGERRAAVQTELRGRVEGAVLHGGQPRRAALAALAALAAPAALARLAERAECPSHLARVRVRVRVEG